ncbi:MAG: aminopeptidase [Candidatus Bathyarchaeia archaeon]
MKFFDLELAKASYTLVKEETLLGLKPDEHLLICADTETDRMVVEAAARAAHLLGSKVAVIWYAAPPDIGEKANVPKPVAAAMSNTDVMVEFSRKYLLFSKAWKNAMENGVRYLGLWGMDVGMMVRLIGNVDWAKMIELGKELVQVSKKVDSMKITSSAGTNVAFKLDAHRPFIRSEVGGGLAGEIAWAPVEETVGGTIVLDGAIFPPEIGILHNPIELKVEKGRIVSIAGGAEAKKLERWLASWHDDSMYNIAHFSYGFNPGAKLSDKILEADRVFGSVVVGIGYQREYYKGKGGVAASHSDGTMQNPTILVGEDYLEKEGKYVHPRLAPISKALGF